MKFTEAKLEQSFIELIGIEGYPHVVGSSLGRSDDSEVIIEDDLKTYLINRYRNEHLTRNEIQAIFLQLKNTFFSRSIRK